MSNVIPITGAREAPKAMQSRMAHPAHHGRQRQQDQAGDAAAGVGVTMTEAMDHEIANTIFWVAMIFAVAWILARS